MIMARLLLGIIVSCSHIGDDYGDGTVHGMDSSMVDTATDAEHDGGAYGNVVVYAAVLSPMR